MHLTEKHQIKKGHKMFKFLDELCSNSKSIYNMANYLVRQEFIRTSRLKEDGQVSNATWIRWNELDKKLKESYIDCYRLLPAKTSQLVLKNLDESWKSFFQSIKVWKKDRNKFKNKPNLPRYKHKEKGRNVVVLNNQQFKIVDGTISFLSSLTKDCDWKPLKTKIPEQAKLVQITISPRQGFYNFNVVYEVEQISLNKNELLNRKTGELKESVEKATMSIDLGINNLCSVTNNVDFDYFLVNGRGLKSLNQWTNKLSAKLQAEGNKNFKDRIWRKRGNKIDYLFNKIVDFVVEQAVNKGCGAIVCGYNKEWKQEVNLGRKTNQGFVQIPFTTLISKLEFKCSQAGIKFVKQEESYTSKCSFLDGEEVCKHEEYQGKRVKRGLFKSAKGLLINADINGSLNILRKYLGEVWKQTDQVEGFVVNPKRINFSF